MKPIQATVIATYSQRMQLRIADGSDQAARIKGKKLRPVCGDRVLAEPIDGETDWLIVNILPRRNALERPNQRGKIEVLAANIEQVIVVAAETPKPDWFVVDRYLCSAAFMGAGSLVVLNKSDLPIRPETDQALAVYREAGYDVLRVSAESGAQVSALAAQLLGKTSIFVGQSGVGKSSLINCMIDAAGQKTAAISDKHQEGRHTTVNSVMIPLDDGGQVIDSPGVRDYAPALRSDDIVESGFREIADAAAHCRFADCKHLREPRCAVKEGVEIGQIDPRRYESYRRALALQDKLHRNRY